MLGLLVSIGQAASAVEPIDIVEQVRLDVRTLAMPEPVHATHSLRLTLVVLEGAGWQHEEVVAVAFAAAGLLSQCGVRLESVERLRVVTPPSYLDLYTPLSRKLAAHLSPPRPTIYFVRDTRQQPAFDAEAVGRGNSRNRPEMADTVWVTRAAQDLTIVLAHELVHVLSNNGEHVELRDNLMRDESAPGNTRLTEEQCARIHDAGVRHGLLQPVLPG